MGILSSETFPHVRHIAVLNGGGIGDLVCVLPSIAALASAYQRARITLLGTPVHALILADRPEAPHVIEVLPMHPGVRDGAPEDPAATADFFERMHSREFDLAVQLHGGGRYSNPFLLRLGATHTIGTRTPDAAELERWVPYTYYQHEVLRALEVVELAGAAPVSLEPHIETTPAERDAVRRYLDPNVTRLLVIHPGATDPRRRWPAEHFAQVATRAAAAGAQVIVVGDASDNLIATEIVQHAQDALSGVVASPPFSSPIPRVSSLAGQLTLPELMGLFTHADVVLGNDSGPRHLAQAVGAPTVGVYWFGNLINAGPLSRTRHRVHLSWTTRCPVCDMDCTKVGRTAQRCEHDVSFVSDVAVTDVFTDVAEFLAARSGTGAPIEAPVATAERA